MKTEVGDNFFFSPLCLKKKNYTLFSNFKLCLMSMMSVFPDASSSQFARIYLFMVGIYLQRFSSGRFPL